MVRCCRIHNQKHKRWAVVTYPPAAGAKSSLELPPSEPEASESVSLYLPRVVALLPELLWLAGTCSAATQVSVRAGVLRLACPTAVRSGLLTGSYAAGATRVACWGAEVLQGPTSATLSGRRRDATHRTPSRQQQLASTLIDSTANMMCTNDEGRRYVQDYKSWCFHCCTAVVV
jgi:hypothetical protein